MRRASRIAQTGAYARSDLLIRTSDYNLLTVSQISLARDIPRDRYIDTDGERERERERERESEEGVEGGGGESRHSAALYSFSSSAITCDHIVVTQTVAQATRREGTERSESPESGPRISGDF